jgi:hypothetical protein
VFSLSKEDQLQVRVTIRTGTVAREINRAHCLNLREKGRTIIEISDTLELTPRTIIDICSTYEERGLEAALHDDPRSGRPVEHDVRVKSYVVATVCSDPPEGFDRWTLELLKGRLEKDEIVENISIGSLWAILQEHDLKPWQQKMWCIPVLDEEYIKRMEAVLDVYELPYNPEVPVVCVDEKPVVLHAEVRTPIKMEDGRPKRVDYEYKRNGTANVFCGVEPKAGQYLNKVTPTRCALEFAQFMADVATKYKSAKKIICVMDNLSTHKEKSLIDLFGEKGGKQLWDRFHVVYTPKHASWLNQAEIAIGMYQRQCLCGTRNPDIPILKKRTAFWNKVVNAKRAVINWTFTKQDARERFDYG